MQITASGYGSYPYFTGWVGAGCEGAVPCTLIMDSDKTLQANFAWGSRPNPVVVSMSRTGSGTIRSAPMGINCGNVCAYDFTKGTKVTLVAIPKPGRRFLGWSGACTGTIAQCVVKANGPLSVQGNFSP